MKNNFEHKGLTAQIEYSNEDNCFVGRVQNIEGLVMFAGDSVDELKAEFIAAVDEYIAAREAAGLPAEKAYGGTFNVRVGPDVHRKAQNAATRCHLSLNEFVKQAIQARVDEAAKAHESPARPVGHVLIRNVRGGLRIQSHAEAAASSVPSEQSWDVLGSTTQEQEHPIMKREWMQ